MPRRSVRFYLILSFLLSALAGCAQPHYTAEDLLWLRAKTVEGVVSTQSRGSFGIKDAAGEETIFRTGELTQYLPENYRSQPGDRVEVAYQEVRENSGRVKLAVLQLKALTIADANMPPTNPLQGTFLDLGRGSMQYYRSFFLQPPAGEEPLQIYLVASTPIEWDGQTWTADSLPHQTWEEAIGYPVQVSVKRLPILRGNAYIYEASRLVLPNLRR
ncbi:MAG: hypothetical protein IH614_02320 [Desulfuromonadales bacterium]|nr:hypothetical protein [Desulfuromonadales bacterium]